MIMMTFLNYLILVICVLINVAFITLLERKILGYSQLRKGPNKVSVGGILQPFNDAIKLFSKESFKPVSSNKILYLFSPALAITFSLVVFSSFPFFEMNFSFGLTMILIYMVLSMNVYPTLISGWSSNSKYAMVGSLRAVAQTISYEVSLALIFLFFLTFSSSLSLTFCSQENFFWGKYFLYFPMLGLWLISCIAETNRTPFDFAEGESELVSGFNIEYGAVSFAMIFMAEYASIYFMSVLFTVFFLPFQPGGVSCAFSSTILVFIWVWARTTLPRYRFDLLMNMAWKFYLPVTLFFFGYAVSGVYF
nr:NADH dehydrogenase subunit 1 [Phyllodiaptomus tunguidus]UDF84423.1 NADH dehydrogenase subunit 1 [Phyllodiaptomus tunguidus]